MLFNKPNRIGFPGLTLTFDSQETMEKVFSGDQQAAMGAFMQGKVKFSGDMGLGQ